MPPADIAVRPTTTLALGLAGVLAVTGLVAAALSAVPYDTWLALANHYSFKGNAADIFTPAFYASMVGKARLAAAAAVLLSGLAAWQRRRLGAELAGITADARPLARDMRARLAAITAEDGRLIWLALGLITLAGLALRLSVAGQPLRYDESLIFETFAKLPAPLIATLYTNVGNHVFHTLLLHLSWLAFGDAVWAIRLPVLICGTLVPPLVWLVARNGWGSTAGLTAAALAAGSSALIEYSANARGYMVLTLLVLVQMLLAQTLARRDNRTAWALWPVVAALSFWTLPVAILSHGAIILWLAWAIVARGEQQRSGLIRLTAASVLGGALTLVLYAPILVVFGMGHMAVMTADKGDHAGLAAAFVQHAVELWGVWSRNLPMPLAILVAAAAAIGAALSHRGTQRAPLALCLLLWLGVLGVVFPVFGFARLWLAHWTLVIILTGAGLGWLVGRLPPAWRRAATITLAAVLLAVPASEELRHRYVLNEPQDAFFEAHDAALWLTDHLQAGDLIEAPSPAAYPLYYAFSRQGRTLRVVSRMRVATRTAIMGQLWQAFSLDGAPPADRPHRLYIVRTGTTIPLEALLVELVPAGAPLPDAPVVARLGQSLIYQLELAPLAVAEGNGG